MGRKEKVILPTAPRATRSPDFDDQKVPKVAPFLAYISNLSYDVEESDISDFFRNLEVKRMYLCTVQYVHYTETALHIY
jgi:translation initiation factor 4B